MMIVVKTPEATYQGADVEHIYINGKKIDSIPILAKAISDYISEPRNVADGFLLAGTQGEYYIIPRKKLNESIVMIVPTRDGEMQEQKMERARTPEPQEIYMDLATHGVRESSAEVKD